jgi:V8-like Glu-specific endopeptidase
MADSASSYPYDTVVRITDTIGSQSWQASGVLISPDEVLTASHVVYTQGIGTASNIIVTPGYNDGSSPYGSADGTPTHYIQIDDANRSISNQQSQLDYAIIHLATPFTSAGFMGLEANFAGGPVNITGYPASAGGAQVNSSQTVSLNRSYSLLDGTSLGEGSSGGPLWIETAGGPSVVGLVSTESGSTGYNTLITTAVLNQIESWVEQDDAQPAIPTPIPAPTPGEVILHGSHNQYVVASNNSSPYVQDTVAGRDGTQTLPGVTEMLFTDGTGLTDATGNVEEAARLYKAAFNRTPDVTGLKNVTAPIDGGTMSVTDVANYFVVSPEFISRYSSLSDMAFVQQLYANVLGRTGSAQEANAWADQISHGMSRGAVLVGFSDSFENKTNTLSYSGDKDYGEAYRLYQAALNRTPDTFGLRGWTTSLDNGMSLLDVAGDFVSSSEFTGRYAGLDNTGFVQQLYGNALHRAGGTPEVNAWVDQINHGMSKATVLLGFSDSLENRINTASATHDNWVFVAKT